MKYLYSVFMIFLFFLFSCNNEPEIRIAISKGSGSPGYEQYAKWVKEHYPKANTIDLYGMEIDEAVDVLETCSGLILSGGPDVHPDRFGKGYDTLRCSIDHYRDTLEFALIEKARRMKLPVLGICRGLQIMNVAFGGSLIVDIPEDYGTEVIHQDSTGNVFHNVYINEGTYLAGITGLKDGLVNSNHHQAIDRLADDFVISSKSKDGIIESIEYKDYENKPFFMAVHWHPERLTENKDLSSPIVIEFIDAVKDFYRYYGYRAANKNK